MIVTKRSINSSTDMSTHAERFRLSSAGRQWKRASARIRLQPVVRQGRVCSEGSFPLSYCETGDYAIEDAIVPRTLWIVGPTMEHENEHAPVLVDYGGYRPNS